MDAIEVVIFGIKLNLKPIAFTIPIGNGWDVYWYGIIIAIGFLLAVVYAIRNASRFGLNKDRMLDVTLITVPLAILCARAYYVIFDGEKLTSIKDFFGFGDSSGFSGLAIYGGVIGAFLIGPIACKLRKVNIFDMFDIASIGFIIGQCIGRWGNFVNQEAFGTFTGSNWWGMESERTISYMKHYLTEQAEASGELFTEITGEGLVHPCFLYESLWCLAGFFILHFVSKKRKFSGQIFLMYCAWYGFGRAFIEMLRTDSLMWGNFRISSLLSFVICFAAIVLLVIFLLKAKKSALVGNYNAILATEEGDAFEKKEDFKEIKENIIKTEGNEENINDHDN